VCKIHETIRSHWRAGPARVCKTEPFGTDDAGLCWKGASGTKKQEGLAYKRKTPSAATCARPARKNKPRPPHHHLKTRPTSLKRRRRR
ncbi:hypothetical protein LSAT2_001591, partial [Lamellibrachia satsuma]